MKSTYIRRIRRKPAASKDNPAFRKEGQKENTFFGEAAQDTFFQPSPVIQRKCDKCPEQLQRKEDSFLKTKKINPPETISSNEEKVKNIMLGVFSNKDSKIYTYISSKLGALKSDVPVKVLSDAEFGHFYRPYAKKRHAEPDTSVPDAKLEPEVRGFYDPDKKTIYLRQRSTWCHAFHETVHSFSDPDFIMDYLGKTLNEGITQYFTDIVMKEQVGSVCGDHKYGDELTCAKKLIETIFSFDDIAKLFFQQDKSILKKVADKFGYKQVEHIKRGGGLPCARINSMT